MSVLTVRDLSKAFGGVQALSGVSFSVDAGELLAMIGPNGAGKTTCFHLSHGQLRPDAGEIRLDDKSIQGRGPRELSRVGVGRTFQVAAAFGSMTVRENVQVALLSREGRLASILGDMQAQVREEAGRLLALVGMLDQAERACSILSYGDLKRVELAIALAGRPRLLLMDEPTAGMAPAERAAQIHLAADLARSAGIAILFTEHDMEVVFAHADRVIVLAEGRLIAEGPPAEVRADARVREVYLGS